MNKLLNLPRAECSSDGRWGVHHGNALTACQIIAMNAFNGYLGTSATNSEETRVRGDHDQILFETEYYFFIPGLERYPVVGVFNDWLFPSSIPASWIKAHAAMLEGDGDDRSRSSCLVTGGFIVDRAHLCPAVEKDWFTNNNMDRFGSNGINSADNIVSVDCCLRRTLDQQVWAFAPRGGKLSVQTLGRASTHKQLCQFVTGYHGLPIKLAQGAAQFYFAHFAWTVIGLFRPLLLQRTRSATLLTWFGPVENAGCKLTEQTLTPKQVSERYASPEERARSAQKESDEDDLESLDSLESLESLESSECSEGELMEE